MYFNLSLALLSTRKYLLFECESHRLVKDFPEMHITQLIRPEWEVSDMFSCIPNVITLLRPQGFPQIQQEMTNEFRMHLNTLKLLGVLTPCVPEFVDVFDISFNHIILWIIKAFELVHQSINKKVQQSEIRYHDEGKEIKQRNHPSLTTLCRVFWAVRIVMGAVCHYVAPSILCRTFEQGQITIEKCIEIQRVIYYLASINRSK